MDESDQQLIVDCLDAIETRLDTLQGTIDRSDTIRYVEATCDRLEKLLDAFLLTIERMDRSLIFLNNMANELKGSIQIINNKATKVRDESRL